MRIATWNVNSVRQRIENLMSWLKECSPDIVCLQEIKCTDEAFPRLEIESLGYNVVTHGQKTFNGVALLSKLPFDETKSGLAGDDEDAHARFHRGRGDAQAAACCGSPAFICPTAIRRTPTNIPTSSNGCRGFLSIRGSGLRQKNRWCWLATST